MGYNIDFSRIESNTQISKSGDDSGGLFLVCVQIHDGFVVACYILLQPYGFSFGKGGLDFLDFVLPNNKINLNSLSQSNCSSLNLWAAQTQLHCEVFGQYSAGQWVLPKFLVTATVPQLTVPK